MLGEEERCEQNLPRGTGLLGKAGRHAPDLLQEVLLALGRRFGSDLVHGAVVNDRHDGDGLRQRLVGLRRRRTDAGR